VGSSDPLAARAAELHAKALEADAVAAQYRAERDELIDLGAGQPAAGDQMVQPLPLIPVGGGEGIDIHGRSVS